MFHLSLVPCHPVHVFFFPFRPSYSIRFVRVSFTLSSSRPSLLPLQLGPLRSNSPALSLNASHLLPRFLAYSPLPFTLLLSLTLILSLSLPITIFLIPFNKRDFLRGSLLPIVLYINFDFYFQCSHLPSYLSHFLTVPFYYSYFSLLAGLTTTSFHCLMALSSPCLNPLNALQLVLTPP